jgi:phospholipid/cholesterol/gamma-HCH transport system substrate-binding protein
MTPMTSVRRRTPLVTVLVIVMLCLVGFVYLYTQAGGRLPGQGEGYRVSFRTTDVKNTQPAGEVRIAGVRVGEVVSQDVEGDVAQVQLQLEQDIAPLHEGATVRIGVKSVIGQSFVEIEDGDGDELPDGAVLEGDSVLPAVDIDEVIGTFDPQTRRALSGALFKLGASTEGRARQIDQLLTGLGHLGREGYTVVDAIEAQGRDLESLVNEATTILASLNGGREQISSLVRNAQTLTKITAGQSADLEATMRRLPPLLDAATVATSTLDGLGTDLGPVATDLDSAAPDLSAALDDLPSITHDLRALLRPMNASLGRANETLVQVPDLANDLSGISPDLQVLLSNVNPMVEYMQPWTLDLGSFFGNFGASFDEPIENGVQPVRLAPIFNEYSVRNNPLDLTTLNRLHWVNPYPSPGGALNPQPYRGTYPRVRQDD